MERFLDYFKPERYDLEECFFRNEELMRGQVEITGELLGNQLKLHAVDLKIQSVEWRPEWTDYEDPSDEYGFESCEYRYDGTVLEIPFSTAMREILERCESNSVTLQIRFETHLNRNMQGCYLSTYQQEGIERRLVTTQFESHYAREAFPCIDEPAAKAVFDLTLILPDYNPACDVVLSNMPVIGQTNGRFEFATTPRMSTYLLAWVAGPLKNVSTTNRHGVKVTSYCALNQPTESLLFANDTAAKALDYFDEKFGVKYPLAKLDQVALPDFEAGAMENWGLVTYRESCLLAEPTAAVDTKQSVAVTVTHELSHQWFGDLVTMQWWDDLWLNESFATIMEYYATDALYPEFNAWQDFFTSDAIAAFRRDALPGVQSVQQDVHNPAEIATLFDSAIVYAKGARLILMLVRLMGEEKFYQGVHSYFLKHQYQNAVADDLWQALQPFADFDVKAFMHAWITQPGYPVLTRKTSLDESPERDPLALDLGPGTDWVERRFLIDDSLDGTTWPLPEVFSDMSGYYLISLSDAEFAEQLRLFDQLSLEQRLRLLIDRMLLAKTVRIPSSSLLDLLPKFQEETSAPIWDTALSIINDLKLFCPPETPARQLYQQYLIKLIQPQLDQLKLAKSTDTNSTRLRDTILSIACFAENQPVLKCLAELYQTQLTRLDSELRSAILFAKMHFDEEEIFSVWLQQYQTETAPDLKSDLLYALSLAKAPAHLDRLIALLSQPAIVRPQDHIFLFVYLLRNYRLRRRALDWLMGNWDYVAQLTGEKSLEDYVRYAAQAVQDEAEAQKFYEFFDQKLDDPVLSRAIKVAHTEIDARLRLIAVDSAGVVAKLQDLAKRQA